MKLNHINTTNLESLKVLIFSPVDIVIAMKTYGTHLTTWAFRAMRFFQCSNARRY